MKLSERLFLANALVLIAHQIEAAYWHEWDMVLSLAQVGVVVQQRPAGNSAT